MTKIEDMTWDEAYSLLAIRGGVSDAEIICAAITRLGNHSMRGRWNERLRSSPHI
jgi:hypothetical protein